MKKLENKKCTLVGKETTYADILLICNDIIPEKGWTVKVMAQSIKLDTILKEAKEIFEIEDADMDYVKQIVDNMGWGTKDISIIEFCEYIKSIK